MNFGGAMFFTDYSMSAPELARALEERGFESVWAPEHSHIPLSRKTPFPGGGDLPKPYYDAMDRRWREMDSNYWYRGTKAVDFRSIPGIAGYRRARKRYHLMVQPLFFCASSHSIEPGWGTV